jgi:hypothetical protein
MRSSSQPFALLVLSALVAAPLAVAASPDQLSRPIHAKDRLDQVPTSIGYYCPNHAACSAAPANPYPKRRLKARRRSRIVVVTRFPARDVWVDVTRPRPDPQSSVVIQQAQAQPAGPQRRHWHFRLRGDSDDATSLDITVGYKHGSAVYFARMRVID